MGAGASGAFAARRLKQIAEKEGKAISIVTLEKDSEAGENAAPISILKIW